MKNISPILITSPCQRSGTTLLVRLLNSSRNTMIYGENAANDIAFLINQITHRRLFLAHNKNQRDLQLQTMLDGNLNQWIPDLLPKIDDYLNSMEKAFFNHIYFFEEYAKKKDRDVWGVKQPGWTGGNINVLWNSIPKSKVIYIYRNIESCLQSAKGIQLVNNSDDAKVFLQGYLNSYNSVMQLPDSDKMLKIEFSDLIENPEKSISKIQTFTGISDIDRSVMDTKINTYFGDNRSKETKDGYISPIELSKDEKNLITEVEGKMIN